MSANLITCILGEQGRPPKLWISMPPIFILIGGYKPTELTDYKLGSTPRRETGPSASILVPLAKASSLFLVDAELMDA
jgi:hypothetical protein